MEKEVKEGTQKKERNEKGSVVARSVGYSILFTAIILFILFLIIYANRSAISSQFVTGYMEQNSASVENGSEGSGPYLSENSRVVEVVDEAVDSVVSIVISKEQPVLERHQSIGPFGLPRSHIEVKGTKEQKVGAGSGFIVSKDGLVVTNKHVVSEKDAKYTVVTADGEKYAADVIARDPFTDLAILKIKSDKTFDTLQFGNSQKLALGQRVIAIGNALGRFQNTVSVGVVSGLSRSIVARGDGKSEKLDRVIQTDAALNPGNSGGPLLALSGKVVGINVAIAGAGENISFAIPSNFVKSIVASVKKTGEIVHPFLGVRYVPVSSLSPKSKITAEHGALVFSGTPGVPSVLPGSPADLAGIENGDIILAVDGMKVTKEKGLGLLIRQKNIGEKANLLVLHDGKKIQLTATLKKAPKDVSS